MPNLNRRGFLSRLAGGATVATALAVAVPVVVSDPDVSRVGRWTFRWAGWRTPANQLCTFGIWTAHQDGQDEHGWYATTTGSSARFHPFDVVYLGAEPGWPPLTETARHALSTEAYEERKRQLRANALRLLMERVRGA